MESTSEKKEASPGQWQNLASMVSWEAVLYMPELKRVNK